MKSKLLFLILAMLLIVPNIVNAVIEWEFDFAKLNESKFLEIDLPNTTALIRKDLNMTQVGFTYRCHYEGEASVPSCWTL